MSVAKRGILLDIEGTTSSISFVYDEMFPYVRRELDSFLEQNWNQAELTTAVDMIADEAGHSSSHDWLASHPTSKDKRAAVSSEVIRLMDADVKSTGLKLLQGQIWKSGFESGELKAHLYPDVLPSLQRWTDEGCDIRIYSSGSVQAQQLFFGHTVDGDLLSFFRGHYDTTSGPKRDADSYRKIAKDYAIAARQITFYSDVPAELDAASQAGMSTYLVCRPGNAPVATKDHVKHERVTCFA